jgi:hypothetical protein
MLETSISDVRRPGGVSGAAPGKGSRSKHRPTSCLARNDVALPSRVIAHLERAATDRWDGERATDGNHFSLARDLVQPPSYQPDLVRNMSRWRTGNRLRVLLRGVDWKLDRVACRHDCDRDELAMAQDGNLPPAGMWLGQDQVASSADGGDASPVVQGATQRFQPVARHSRLLIPFLCGVAAHLLPERCQQRLWIAAVEATRQRRYLFRVMVGIGLTRAWTWAAAQLQQCARGTSLASSDGLGAAPKG